MYKEMRHTRNFSTVVEKFYLNFQVSSKEIFCRSAASWACCKLFQIEQLHSTSKINTGKEKKMKKLRNLPSKRQKTVAKFFLACRKIFHIITLTHQKCWQKIFQ